MKAKELGHAGIYVRDLEASVHFYRDLLGFNEVGRLPGTVLLSSGQRHHDLALIEPGQEAIPAPELPYFSINHIAIKVGDSPGELRLAHAELVAAGITIDKVWDHGVTHSIYVRDPDGIEVEIFVDVTTAWRDHPELLLRFPTPLLGQLAWE